jgi:hypothetical protein
LVNHLDKARQDVGFPGGEEIVMEGCDVSLESHQVEFEAQIACLDLGDLVFEVMVAGVQGVQRCGVSLRRRLSVRESRLARAQLTSTDEREDSESKVDCEMDKSADKLGSYSRCLRLMVTRSALGVFLLG